MTNLPTNPNSTDAQDTQWLIELINKFIKENNFVPEPNPINYVAGSMKLGEGHWLIQAILAHEADAEIEKIKARLVELDLLEQALNQGIDIQKFKLQRLVDLTKRFDTLQSEALQREQEGK